MSQSRSPSGLLSSIALTTTSETLNCGVVSKQHDTDSHVIVVTTGASEHGAAQTDSNTDPLLHKHNKQDRRKSSSDELEESRKRNAYSEATTMRVDNSSDFNHCTAVAPVRSTILSNNAGGHVNNGKYSKHNIELRSKQTTSNEDRQGLSKSSLWWLQRFDQEVLCLQRIPSMFF